MTRNISESTDFEAKGGHGHSDSPTQIYTKFYYFLMNNNIKCYSNFYNTSLLNCPNKNRCFHVKNCIV